MIVPGITSLKTDKIALIDADFIKYHVLSSFKEDYKTFTDVTIKEKVLPILNSIKQKIECPGYIFCFTGESNYRDYVSFEKKYKGNRDTSSDGLVHTIHISDIKREVVKFIKSREASLEFPELEADDIVAMLQDDETFIYSEDKDLRQVPGTHYDIKQNSFVEISNEDAFRFLMTQLLIGDTVDNVPGLKSYGINKTENLLTDCKTNQLVYVVLQQFIKANGMFKGIDSFVENWNLLKLRLNRGEYFKLKYAHAFDTLELIKNNK